MITSKVNFYFYKKRQSKQYKTHWKDITERASSGAWLCKGCWVQRERKGHLVPGLSQRLLWRKGPAETPVTPDWCQLQSWVLPILIPQRVKLCQGRAVVGLLRWGVGELRGTFRWNLEFQMDILAFTLPAMSSGSSNMAAGRGAWPSAWSGAFLARNSLHKCTASLGWQALPLGSPQTWHYRVSLHRPARL